MPHNLARVHTHAIEKYQFLHHFLPHPDTKKRAKLLQHGAMMTYALVLVVFIGLSKAVPKLAPGVLGYASDIKISELLKGTNKIRNENGLNSLTVNASLTRAAEAKAQHMFKHNYWAHVAPDGTTPWDFILDVNYDYSYAGENLAKNFDNSNEVVKAWFNSPSHKENLLNRNYDEIGFAVVDGVLDGYQTTLVVQVFGRQRQSVPIASKEDGENILKSAEAPAEVAQGDEVVESAPIASDSAIPAIVPVLTQASEPSNQVLPAIDVAKASKSITFAVSGFLLVLLALDIWYSRRKAIPKLSGNVFAHITFLVMTVVGVWFALIPGKIL